VDLHPDVTTLSSAALRADRTLRVPEPIAELLGRPGLARGQIVACTGTAGTSLAFALVTCAVAEGAWLAVVDVPWVGLDAVADLGIPLERIVRVETRSSSAIGRRWAEVVAAAVDGFELIVTRLPPAATGSAVRKLRARLQRHGSVLVAIGRHEACSPDLVLDGSPLTWDQAAAGAGHLTGRRVLVEASGRRLPLPRRADLLLPGPTGGIGVPGATRSTLRRSDGYEPDRVATA